MPSEVEYINYKAFVESLDPVENPSSNDKVVVCDSVSGPRSTPGSSRKKLDDVSANSIVDVVTKTTSGSATYGMLAELWVAESAGYYDMSYEIASGYTAYGSGNNNIFTIAVLNSNNVETWFDCVATYSMQTRIKGGTQYARRVYIEKGWKVVAKGRITCSLLFSISKSDSYQSEIKYLRNSIVDENPQMSQLMELGGIYITSIEWTYNTSSDDHYYSRVRTKNNVAVWLNAGDVVHCDNWNKIVAYIGSRLISSQTGETYGWNDKDFVAPVDAYYVITARYINEADFEDEAEIQSVINSLKIIRQAQSLEEELDDRIAESGELTIKNKVVSRSFVGSSAYNSELAQLYTIAKDGYYDLGYYLDGDYAINGSGSNVELEIYATKNNDIVWQDVIALSKVTTRLNTKTDVRKLYLEKGTIISVGGRITCRLIFEIKFSDSLSSCCEYSKKELVKEDGVSAHMGRGGIYIVTDEWTYNTPSDLPYYRSRVCTSSNYVLWMNQGDVITSKLLGEVVFYIGWKAPADLHSEFQAGWQSAAWTAPKDAYYVFQARYATERELSDSEVSEIINSFSVIRKNKNIEERVEILEKSSNSPYDDKQVIYYGDRLPLNAIYARALSDIVMDGTSEAVNGLAIDGNTLVTLYNGGIARLYAISGSFEISEPSELFDLGSKASNNHSNCGSFGNKYESSDVLPLLYVSQYHIEGGRCFVERINKSSLSSTLIQTINIANGLYGYSIDWVVDKERQRLIAFGNTSSSSSANNKHRVMVFDIPSLESSDVTLTASDAVENYFMEDYSDDVHTMVGDVAVFSVQGCFAKNGFIYCLASGSQQQELTRPKSIYCWDYVNKRLHAKVPLNGVIDGELEDIEFFNGSIVVQSGYGKNVFFKLFV